MEQDKKMKLELEDSLVLENVIPKFNRIYKQEVRLDGDVLTFKEGLLPRHLFILGGYYGTELHKKKKG